MHSLHLAFLSQFNSLVNQPLYFSLASQTSENLHFPIVHKSDVIKSSPTPAHSLNGKCAFIHCVHGNGVGARSCFLTVVNSLAVLAACSKAHKKHCDEFICRNSEFYIFRKQNRGNSLEIQLFFHTLLSFSILIQTWKLLKSNSILFHTFPYCVGTL